MSPPSPRDALEQAPTVSIDYSIECIEDEASLYALQEEWNALLQTNGTRTVELTFEWQITYWKHFNQNARLFVLVVRQAGHIVAIAPLKISSIRKYGIPVRQLEFIAASESNYQDFLLGSPDRGVFAGIQRYLQQHEHLWDVFYAMHIPKASPLAEFLEGHSGDAFRSRLEALERCIFALADKSWSDHTADLSKKSRAQIRNRTRRLQKHGRVTTQWCATGEEMQAYLETFFALHRKRWNATDTPSQFNDNRYCDFYQEVSSLLKTKGQVELFVLNVDTQPVALLYCFCYEQEWLIQLISWDSDYTKAAPSVVMHELFMEELFGRDGVRLVDFGNYHSYKELWANQFKYRVNLELYPRRLKPTLVFVLTITLNTIKEYLKGIKPLRRLVRSVKSRLYSIQRRLPGSNVQ